MHGATTCAPAVCSFSMTRGSACPPLVSNAARLRPCRGCKANDGHPHIQRVLRVAECRHSDVACHSTPFDPRHQRRGGMPAWYTHSQWLHRLLGYQPTHRPQPRASDLPAAKSCFPTAASRVSPTPAQLGGGPAHASAPATADNQPSRRQHSTPTTLTHLQPQDEVSCLHHIREPSGCARLHQHQHTAAPGGWGTRMRECDRQGRELMPGSQHQHTAAPGGWGMDARD